MKIIYEFTTETIEIEVDETYYDILIELEKEEKNLNRKHSRRYPVSLESVDYDGAWFADGIDLLDGLLKHMDDTSLHSAIRKLSLSQQELIHKVFFQEISLVRIAREEGVTEGAIRGRLKRIYKNLKENLK